MPELVTPVHRPDLSLTRKRAAESDITAHRATVARAAQSEMAHVRTTATRQAQAGVHLQLAEEDESPERVGVLAQRT